MRRKHRGSFLVLLFSMTWLSLGSSPAAGLSLSVEDARRAAAVAAPDAAPLSDESSNSAPETDGASSENEGEGEGELDLILPSSLTLPSPSGGHADSHLLRLPDPVFTATDAPPNKLR